MAALRLIGKKSAIFFTIFSLYRRGLQAVIILALIQYPPAQILFTLLLNMAYTVFVLNRRVFSSRKEQCIEVLNEIMTVMTIILLSCFLTIHFIPDQVIRTKVSFSFLALTCLNFFIAAIIIGFEVVHTLKLKCAKCQNKSKHKQLMRERQEKEE